MINTPVLYVGAPGTGKTAMVKSQYDHCEILLMSSQVEEDIAGIPYRDGAFEKRTIPLWLQRILKADSERKTTCLFLDELDKARREVTDTILTLIVSPEYFGIPQDTDIVAAANPPEWGGGDGISMPMLSRFSIIDYKPDFQKWLKYMLEKYENNPLVVEIMKGFENLNVPFLETTGDGYNWRLTCPRTIDMAITALLRNEYLVEKKIKGLLTPNVSSYLLAFLLPKSEKGIVETQEICRTVSTKRKYLNPIRI